MNSFLNKLIGRIFPPPEPLVAAGKTDPGSVRAHNEDYFKIHLPCNLFIVADGMGGHSAGEVASRLAVEAVADYFTPLTCKRISGNREAIQHAMIAATNHANETVMAAAETRDGCAGMGCTLVVCLVDHETLHVCHVGDSRCYRANAARIERLTRDDSYVEEMSASARSLTMKRNVLTRAIGFPFSEDPHFTSLPLAPGDRVLLCSDGLWNMIEDQIILHLLRETPSARQACDRLVSMANKAGGTDNITVVVINNHRSRP